MPQRRLAGWLAALSVVLSACGAGAAPASGSTQDVGVIDAAAVDAAQDASDTNGADTSDVQGIDAAAEVDGAGTDAGPSKEQVCAGYVEQYSKQLKIIRECHTPSECNTQTPAKLDCACGVFANAGAAEWSQVQQASQAFFAHKCPTCFQATCQDDATQAYLGDCVAGQCTSKLATCDAISAQWSSLKADAQACKTAADCTAKLGVAVNCDACQVPANGALLAETAAQGKYAALLKTLWDSQSCGAPAPCACAPVGAVDCVAGSCQAK